MSIRAKLSALLSVAVVAAVFVTTLALSRFFVEDQEAYLNDLQSTLALFNARELESRLLLLHSELGAVVGRTDVPFELVLQKIEGLTRGSLWRDGKRIAGTLDIPAPPAGKSRWTLVPGEKTGIVRWIGRFGRDTAQLELRQEWFSGLLEASHGSQVELVAPDGTVLLGSSVGQKFRPLGVIAQALENPKEMARTQRYLDYEKRTWLGAFVPLSVDPPLVLTVRTPYSAVEEVIGRTLRRSAWIGLLFLCVAIALGAAFSTTLTRALRTFTDEMMEIASGKYEMPVSVGSERRDEVGILARSFNRMVTKLREAREELKRSERMAALGQFGSAIAHEIKNPLTVILGNIQLAKRMAVRGAKQGDKTLVDPKALCETLTYAEEEVDRANRTIGQLLKFARREKAPDSAIDLVERARHTIEVLRPLAEKAGVALTGRFPGESIFCLADGDQIHEVLVNLIQNAVHAMQSTAEKTLMISVDREERFCLITVADTGQGMSEEVKAHLFEPFFTTKGIGQGTGLGLAVCHGIVLNHNGRIEVESRRGQGTRFFIRLPLHENPAEQEKAA